MKRFRFILNDSVRSHQSRHCVDAMQHAGPALELLSTQGKCTIVTVQLCCRIAARLPGCLLDCSTLYSLKPLLTWYAVAVNMLRRVRLSPDVLAMSSPAESLLKKVMSWPKMWSKKAANSCDMVCRANSSKVMRPLQASGIAQHTAAEPHLRMTVLLHRLAFLVLCVLQTVTQQRFWQTVMFRP